MQKDSAADIELNLKKKARRRLVGAIAMVVLMVILLPILLKDRSAAVSKDEVKISIQHEEAAEGVLAPTAPSDFDSNVVSADAHTEKSAGEAEKTVELPAPVEETKSTPPIEDPEAAAGASKPLKPEPAKSEIGKLDSVKETTKDTSVKGQFFVQIGVFSEMANVKQLQSKLSSLGYTSKTEKINTPKGVKIRLRSQVFNSRNEAAIALQNIKDAGLTGMVVSQ